MNQEIASSAATFHVLHCMEKQTTLWRAYGLCRALIQWKYTVGARPTSVGTASPNSDGAKGGVEAAPPEGGGVAPSDSKVEADSA